MKTTKTEQDILGVLFHAELSPLLIIDRLPEKTRLGRIFVLLNRLEKKGLISSRWGNPIDGGSSPRRKLYTATDMGRLTGSQVNTEQMEAERTLKSERGRLLKRGQELEIELTEAFPRWVRPMAKWWVKAFVIRKVKAVAEMRINPNLEQIASVRRVIQTQRINLN